MHLNPTSITAPIIHSLIASLANSFITDIYHCWLDRVFQNYFIDLYDQCVKAISFKMVSD